MNVDRFMVGSRLAAALIAVGLSGIVTGRMATEPCPDCVRFDVSYSPADRTGLVRTQIACGPGPQCGVPISANVYGVQRTFDLILTMDRGYARASLRSEPDQPTWPPLAFNTTKPEGIPISAESADRAEFTMSVKAPERASAGGYLPYGIHYLVVRNPDPTIVGRVSVRVSPTNMILLSGGARVGE